LSSEDQGAGQRRFVGTTRLEAFSDGVFAIAITLLVLDLAIGGSGSPWERVVDGWPFYLAYVVSFLTIGAAWLAHTLITDRLAKADLTLLRINLLLLLVVGVLPFPTGLVAESIEDLEGERVFVALYGLTFLAMRLLLTALYRYAWRERLFAADTVPSNVVNQNVWAGGAGVRHRDPGRPGLPRDRGRLVLPDRGGPRGSSRRGATPRHPRPVAQ
jgi:uncharacterized membrane protein